MLSYLARYLHYKYIAYSAALIFMVSSCSPSRVKEDISKLSGNNISESKNEVRLSGAKAIPVGQDNYTQAPVPEPDRLSNSSNNLPPEETISPAAFNAVSNIAEDELNEMLKDLNKPTNPPYLIHRGDVMEISIPFEPESTRVVTVRPDGKIGYLYDVDIPVAGLTYPEMINQLKEALKSYYYNPSVSVNSKVFAGSQVYVMGPVASPGPISVQNSSHLLEVLSKAGVLTLLPKDQLISYSNSNVTNDVVDLKNSYMVRAGKILPINFYALLIKRDMRYNIVVQPDDFIFFPSSYLSDVTKRVYVCGAVAAPSVYNFTTYGTFISALANSGGIDKYRADATKCVVVRKNAGKIITLDYNKIVMGKAEDIPLQDSDIVFIPERGLYESSRWTTTIIGEIIAPLQALIQGGSAVKSVNMQDWNPASNLGAVDNFMK